MICFEYVTLKIVVQGHILEEMLILSYTPTKISKCFFVVENLILFCFQVTGV